MPFIRVRAKDGPKHEYDAPVGEVEANPDLYVVLSDEPVDAPRPVKYVLAEPETTGWEAFISGGKERAPELRSPQKAPKKSTVPAMVAPEPSVGNSREGDA